MEMQNLALTNGVTPTARVYEVRPRSDKRGVNLISHALPFGRLWYSEPRGSVLDSCHVGR